MPDLDNEGHRPLSIANPQLGETEQSRVSEVLESGMLADGPEVRAFEEEFGAYCGTDHAVATSNGTTALHAALEGLELGAGDTVLTSPFSFIASANAVRLAGAEPVFADIDPDTYTLDPASVEAVIESRDGDVDAIMAVHLYGLPADVEALSALAERYDAALIEDAAQAHGATVDGECVGSLGDVACFSFYPTKNMTTGEGGMIVTDDGAIAERASRFINHGRTEQYGHASVGHNFRMTSMAAAIGRVQLEKLDAFTEARQANAARLGEGLADTALVMPTVPDGRTHVFHQYTVRVEDRDAFGAHLDAHDVGYGVYYPTCIHNQPAYEDVSVTVEVPEAERAAREVLSLPVHPGLADRDVDRIIEVISNYDE